MIKNTIGKKIKLLKKQIERRKASGLPYDDLIWQIELLTGTFPPGNHHNIKFRSEPYC